MKLHKLPKQYYVLSECIDEMSSERLRKWLLDNRKEKAVTIYLSTPGGRITDAFAIHDMIRGFEQSGMKIHIVAMGACESAGNIVLPAVKRKRRYATTHTRFLLHPARNFKHDGSVVKCDIKQPSRRLIKEIERISGLPMGEGYVLQTMIMKMLARRTHLSKAQAQKLCRDENYFSAKKALEYGLIGSIISS